MHTARAHSQTPDFTTHVGTGTAKDLCDRLHRKPRPNTQMFVKYNAVLRGLRSKVLFLRTMMVQLCCAKEVAAKFKDGSISFEEASILLNR